MDLVKKSIDFSGIPAPTGPTVMQEEKPADLPLTPEDAKRKVFEHWHHLEALAGRRFPKNENLAHQGLLYVLDQFEADDWRRVRAWEGLGQLQSFLTTLASRLLTDFSRARFGYIRKPKWLAEKGDPLWDAAYRLLLVEKYSRHEAIEILWLGDPGRERWLIGRVVNTVYERCRSQPQYAEQTVPLDGGEESTEPPPEVVLAARDKELIEALEQYLQDGPDPPVTRRVGQILDRLVPHVRLAAEDRLLLRLRYADGLSIKTIVKRLRLQGDPYKRYNKILGHLREACRKAGLAPG